MTPSFRQRVRRWLGRVEDSSNTRPLISSLGNNPRPLDERPSFFPSPHENEFFQEADTPPLERSHPGLNQQRNSLTINASGARGVDAADSYSESDETNSNENKYLEEVSELQDTLKFDPGISAEFRDLLRLERPHDGERGLCQNCAQYDWRWLIARFKLLDLLDIPKCTSSEDVENYLGNMRTCFGERLIPVPLKEQAQDYDIGDVLVIKSSYSKYVAERSPFPGQYFDRTWDKQEEVRLHTFKEMLKTSDECSLCDIIVRNALRLNPKLLSHSDGIDHSKAGNPAPPVKCRIQSFEYAKKSDFIPIPAHQDDLIMTVWIGHILHYRPLTFTFWKGGMLERPNEWARVAIDPYQIDIDTMTKWWHNCKHNHFQCGPLEITSARSDDDFVLRLIDVKTSRVILAPEAVSYVALSYVWGNVKVTKSARHHFSDFEENFDQEGTSQLLLGYRQLDLADLPLTIRDAMLAVELIGEHYLWVDALCIIQDDPVELERTIEAMNLIYKSAALTMVAASGRDASSGLPGLRSQSRDLKTIFGVVDGVGLMSAEPALSSNTQAHALEGAPYMERAWTYQELFFSRRLLIFAADRVYYQCSTGAWGEAAPEKLILRLPASLDVSARSPMMRLSGYAPFDAYAEHVRRFMARNLSFESDIVNAFAGILSEFGSTSNSCWGIPPDFIQLALLWEECETPTGMRERRLGLRRRRRGPSLEAGFFPSWSWVGWIGPVHYRGMCTHFDPDQPIRHSSSGPPEKGPYRITEEVYRTGILEVETLGAVIDYGHDVRGDLVFWAVNLDDGSDWRMGKRECMFLGRTWGTHVKFMIVRPERDTEGRTIYYREGIASLPPKTWDAFQPRKKVFRLG